jgi:hypothetical protein
MPVIVLNGQKYTPDQLKAVYQQDSAAVDATDSAHKTLNQKVLDERATHASTAKVTRALRSFLLGQFGEEAVAILGDFGFSAPKSPSAGKTAATKALASAKAVATRQARGVVGSIKKLSVTGGVTGATISDTGSGAKIAPVTAATTTTGSTQPAATPAPMPPVKGAPQS